MRSAILSGEIPPGSHVLEAEVASRMRVSRAPVREALRQLEQEGLVEFFPHRGSVVVGLPDDEVQTIYELRSVIEEIAISRACEQVTDQDLEELRSIVAAMGEARQSGDVMEVAEVDLRFHRRLVELSGLRLLRKSWSSLDGLVRAKTYQALDRKDKSSRYFLATGVASHTRLIDALRAGDPARAAAAIREHILGIAQRLNEQHT